MGISGFDFITPVEENVVTYISGSLIKKLVQTRSCAECFNLCISLTSLACHELVQLKEYKDGCMIKVSESVSRLCCNFERHFQQSTKNGLPQYTPRTVLMKTFFSHEFLESYNLNCSKDHKVKLINCIIAEYCTLRIHHHIKQVKRSKCKGKRGSELNKDRKLNM